LVSLIKKKRNNALAIGIQILAIKIMIAIGYDPDFHIMTIPEKIVAGVCCPKLIVSIIGKKLDGINKIVAVSIQTVALSIDFGFLK
jgi:hypothetical protein